MSEAITSDIKRNFIRRLVAQGKRDDGRPLDAFRPIEIKHSVVKSAEGSAQVNVGDTSVIVGVKMSVGEPFDDTPDRGVLTTNAELIPMASPSFESGPPGEDSIELARVVDRGIREAHTIDLKKLCIVPKEKVWVLFVDIHVLDYDGNLFDAANMGAVAALSSTVVPAKAVDLGEDFPLPIDHYPVSITFAKIGSSILVDPSLDEEKIADARLTIATDENGHVRAAQKGLSGSFKYDEVMKMMAAAPTIASGIRQLIKKRVA